MRELRFRFWDAKEGKWLGKGSSYWKELTLEDCRNKLIASMRQGDIVAEQYTGLKDKNGKEIYENDVVSEHNGDIKGKVVQSITGEWQIAWIGIFGGYSCLYDHTSLCEVVSNVHESNMEGLCPRE